MAVQMYLVFPNPTSTTPIAAEPVTDPYFGGSTFANAKVIEVSSFSFGVENTATIGSATSGAGGGKAQFGELTITKNADRSSPPLFRMLTTGGHYNTMQLYVRKASATEKKPYLAFEFQTVFVSKLDWSGAGDAEVSEVATLLYGALAVAQRSTDPNGTLTAATRSVWSQLTSTASVTDTLVLS